MIKISKNIFVYFLNAWKPQFFQRNTVRKCIFSNICHIVCAFNAGKAVATAEGIITNTRHTIRDGDAGETGAIIECILPNTCHTVWNRDAGEI